MIHLDKIHKYIVQEIRTMCLDILQVSITYVILSFSSALISEVNI